MRLDFKSAFSCRYPNIILVAGIPRALDSKGKAYVTLMVGGLKQEDSGVPILFAFPASKTSENIVSSLMTMWWEELDRYLFRDGLKPVEVHVRLEPEICPCIDYGIRDTKGDLYYNLYYVRSRISAHYA